MKRNIFYNTLYQLINMVLPLITAPYLSRVIGAGGVGLNSYAKAVAGYFVLFAMQGLNQYGNRAIALAKDSQEEISRTFWEIYLCQFVTSFFALFVYVIYVFTYSGKYKMALMINIIYVISALFDINWFYFGLGKFKLTATRNVIIKTLSTIMIFFLVKSETDIVWYIIISSLGFLLSNVVLWFYLDRYIVKVHVSIKKCIKHMKPNFVLFIAVLAISIYKLMDKVMLGVMSDVIQNGYYEVMSDIITIPLSLITAMGTVMLPQISELVKKGEHEKILDYNRDTIQLMLGLSLPFAVGVICVADTFVPVYFGEAFRESSLVLKLLAISSPFIAFGNVIRTQCVIPLEKDNVFVQATIVGACFNFAINYILIPHYGAIGAAVGTIVAEASVTLYQYIRIHYVIKKLPIIKDNFEFLVVSILMGIIVCFLKLLPVEDWLLILIQIFVGILVYGCLNFIYLYKYKNERFLHWKRIIWRKR